MAKLRSAPRARVGELELAARRQLDEHAIREMATLVAVEHVLKLQEASMPGGTTISRRLLDAAALSAIARLQSIEASFREDQSE